MAEVTCSQCLLAYRLKMGRSVPMQGKRIPRWGVCRSDNCVIPLPTKIVKTVSLVKLV